MAYINLFGIKKDIVDILRDYLYPRSTITGSWYNNSVDTKYAQSFIPFTKTMNSISIYCNTIGTPPSMTVSVYTDSDGTPSTEVKAVTFAPSDITDDAWDTKACSYDNLISKNKYWLVFTCVGQDSSNYYKIGSDSVKTNYQVGEPKSNTNSTWDSESLDIAFNININDWVYCYDKETEILTDNGWKLFKDLTGNENVLTLDKETNIIEYQKIDKKLEFDYNGDMVKIKSNNTDIMVTPNHRFLVLTQANKKKIVKSTELKHGYRVPRTGLWNCDNIEKFILPEYHKSWLSGRNYKIFKEIHREEKEFRIENFLRLFGYYISEGHLDGSNALITQIKPKIREKIKNLLDEMKIDYNEERDGFRLYVQFYNYLKEFGSSSKDKYIPKEFKNLSPNLLMILLESLLDGDGYRVSDNFSQYITSSKQLADDVQEIAIKCGYYGYIANYKKNNCFIVVISKTKKFMYVRPDIISKIHYNDKVYCVTVPNHVIMVRRNGKSIFSCNSVYPSDTITNEDMPRIGIDLISRRVDNRYCSGSLALGYIDGIMLVYSQYPDELDKIISYGERGLFKKRTEITDIDLLTPTAMTPTERLLEKRYVKSVGFTLRKKLKYVPSSLPVIE